MASTHRRRALARIIPCPKVPPDGRWVEPTNNHAERVLRMGVLWRKNAFGCHSESGCRFVERILTVVQTLRLQKRSVLDFLVESVIAHRSGTPAPALLMP